MEDLTKTQIILLTLLVSFVTSIATGITTVTLLDQAPPAVTQTLNRVVEKTIETVIQPASVITNEVQVLVKEEDLVAGAFEKNASSVIMIEDKNGFVGLGTIVSRGGLIIADGSIISPDSKYVVETKNGDRWNVSVATTTSSDIALIKIVDRFIDADEAVGEGGDEDKSESKNIIDSVKDAVGIGESNEELSFNQVTMIRDSVRTGQTAIAIGGVGGDEVLVGIVSKISPSDEEGPETIHTNMSLSNTSSGGPLLDTDGRLIGINIVSKASQYTIPSGYIADLVNSLNLIAPSENTAKNTIDE